MHLGGVILVTLALVAAEFPAPLAPVGPIVRCVPVAVGSLVVVFLAAAVSGLVALQIRSDPRGVHYHLRGYRRLRTIHTVTWFCVAITAVFLLQWPQWVRSELGAAPFIVDELLTLAPLLLPMFVSYAAFFEVDRAAATVLGGGLTHTSRWSYACWFFRHEFGLLLVPLLGVLFFRELGEAFFGPSSSSVAWVTAAAVAGLLIAFPLLLSSIWTCESLHDRTLRAGIESECIQLGMPLPRLRQWNTGGRVVNAIVAGVSPKASCVFLSDALLKHFSQAEILAVVRHELAHAKAHHVLLRVAAMVLPVAIWWAMGLPGWKLEAWTGTFPNTDSLASLALLVVIGTAVIVYLWLFFGRFCRLLELEADLNGCRPRRPGPSPSESADASWALDPAAAQSAQAALCRLGAVYGEHRKNWMHPSIRHRRRVLRAACRSNAFARRVARKIRFWKWMLWGALAATMIAAAVQI